MCGIVGYVGGRDASGVILDGLSRLEYRGYDSAGIAVSTGDKLIVKKKQGKAESFTRLYREEPYRRTCGHRSYKMGYSR